MVRHFVRLKLRLLANRLRTQSVMGTIGYFAIWAAGIVAGVLAGLAVFGLGRLVEEPGPVLILSYTAVFVGWAIIPASLSALDEALDPRRFELLPIGPRRLTLGLLAAGVVTPGGIGTLLGLSIATFGLYPRLSLLPWLLVAVTTELALCLVVARLVTSLLSNLLASRRTRELVTLFFGLVITTVAILPAWLTEPDGSASGEIEITLSSFDWVDRLVWLPSGALAGSVVEGAQGENVVALGLSVYGILLTVIIAAAWARSVRTMLVTAPIAGRTARRRSSQRTLALMPSWLDLRPGPVSGVVAKELRYLVRDNRVRAQLIGSVVPLVVIIFISGGPLDGGPYTPFLAAAVTFLIVLGALANQFGTDGGSLWAYVASPAPLSTVVRGKNLSWGLVAMPLVVVAALVLGTANGDFSYVPAAIFGSAGVLLVSVAIGNVTSIYGAYRIPERNPFGTRGASGSAFFAILISMMVSGALLLPIVALVGLPAAYLGPVAATVGAIAGIAYGAMIYRVGMKVTTRLLIERQQILLDTIDRERV